MICQGCHTWANSRICGVCRLDFRPASDRILSGGIRAIAAFEHTGLAAQMMHSFKYRGVDTILGPVIAVLSPRLPRGALFAPIPRAWSRLLRYGVDPATEFAQRMAAKVDGQVIDPFLRPLHTRRRAGKDHDRTPVPISLRMRVNKPVVVVDDVLTTGNTVLGAVRAIGPEFAGMVVTATSAHRVSSLSPPGEAPSR